MLKNPFYCFLFLASVLTFSGCATTPGVMPTPPAGMPGIYHCVEKGQTLWRICRMYNMDFNEIIRANHIFDTSRIEVGQYIFIPQTQKMPVISDRFSSEDFIWPIKGRVISAFGQTYNNMINKGLNIQALGDGGVLAARSGKVVFYHPNFEGFGKTLIIDHGDGYSSVYARNSQVFFKPGDNVQQGALIAKVGSAGRDRNAYLHFEIRKGHVAQNPYFYLP